jgi:Xaa-Pro aminopeptidase
VSPQRARMVGQTARVVSRLRRARDEMREASLEALVITHPPNVRYLTGFSGTAGLVLLTGTGCLLVADFRYAAAARSLVESDPELREAVTVVVPPRSYDETLLDLLKTCGARRIGIEAAWMSVGRFNRLAASVAGWTSGTGPSDAPVLVPTERMIEKGRSIKDEAEIATLREAGRRLAVVALEAPELVREGRSELEVAADIDTALRRGGFERPAFDTIVASGPNSARPHARPGKRTLRPGDWVLLDFGGVYDGYCVDLSRTVRLGRGDAEFRRVFEAVAEAQRAAIAAVRPGIRASAVDAAAREMLGRHGLAEVFGHGTGHGLGLEVHEEPRIGRPLEGSDDVLLAAGMVFTVEPGAYLDGIGGVRIEDDVLVTDTGCDVLTAAAKFE